MKRILVVDDEPAVREYAQLVLERAGHQVEVASNGLEAQELLHSGGYDVVVTDHVMPGVRGRELVRWIRAHPDQEIAKIRIVLVTGGGDDIKEVVVEIRETHNAELLFKPYMARQLLEKLD